jgi:hypothetical protein
MSLEQFEHLVVQMTAFGQTGEEQSVLGAVEEKSKLEGLVHLLVLLNARTPYNSFSPGSLKATALSPSFL